MNFFSIKQMVLKRQRRRAGVKKIGVYRSRVARANGKAVWQSVKNSGTNRGLFKMSGGARKGKSYIAKKYKKNVRRGGAAKGMPFLEKPKKRRKRKRPIIES